MRSLLSLPLAFLLCCIASVSGDGPPVEVKIADVEWIGELRTEPAGDYQILEVNVAIVGFPETVYFVDVQYFPDLRNDLMSQLSVNGAFVTTDAQGRWSGTFNDTTRLVGSLNRCTTFWQVNVRLWSDEETIADQTDWTAVPIVDAR